MRKTNEWDPTPFDDLIGSNTPRALYMPAHRAGIGSEGKDTFTTQACEAHDLVTHEHIRQSDFPCVLGAQTISSGTYRMSYVENMIPEAAAPILRHLTWYSRYYATLEKRGLNKGLSTFLVVFGEPFDL